MTPALVAAGHPLTADAAIEVLELGGNAYDAVVAAGFAAAVAEPCLTSLAGGGFLLARTAGGDERLFDFFVDTPGRSRADTSPHFVPVTIEFPSSTQDFNVGWGSVAVPGVLAGLLHAHRAMGRLPLDQVVSPAARSAHAGVVLNDQQSAFVTLLEPIVRLTEASAAVFAPGGRLLQAGDVVVNEALGSFIDSIGAGRVTSFADPDVAADLVAACDRHDGLLTQEDLAAYEVRERDPLVVEFRGRRILTNSPPSFGGPLLALALTLLDDGVVRTGVDDALHRLAVLREVEQARLDDDIERRLKVARGTTHVSISDHDGNVASMTTSNGEGAGCFAPGTGVMLNNMLGEDDLHPDGFHADPPGVRVSSMMSPAIVVGSDGAELVVGSGGSKRIRTAILTVIDAATRADPAVLSSIVSSPRFHWDGEQLQVEPGLDAEVEAALAAAAPLNRWGSLDLYFGGVHGVRPGLDAAGDPRRGGTVRRSTMLEKWAGWPIQ